MFLIRLPLPLFLSLLLTVKFAPGSFVYFFPNSCSSQTGLFASLSLMAYHYIEPVIEKRFIAVGCFYFSISIAHFKSQVKP